MRTNKDQPWTWVKYKEGVCNTCIAACCTMPVEVQAEDFVRLGLATEDDLNSKKKLFKKLKKEGVVQSYREGTDLFMITSKPNGDCFFLHPQTRKCTVYEKRPETCRKFPTEIGPKVSFCPYQLLK